MIFTTVSKKAPMFGKGKQLDRDYFEIMEGVKMFFFYDSDSIKQEFGDYGLVEFSEIDEPNKDMKNKPSINFILVKCKKKIIKVRMNFCFILPEKIVMQKCQQKL